MACLLTLPLHALGSGGFSRIHATIGQPLSIQVPLELSGSRPGNINVGVEAVAGVPDAERDVADSVVATYDRLNSRVQLTTPRRVTVPAIRLRLTIAGEALSITQDIDVLVDLPDFSRNFDRPAAAERAESGDVAISGIKLFEAHRHGPEARLYGDSAAVDGAEASSDRPAATPTRAAAEHPDAPTLQPGHVSKKQSHSRSSVAADVEKAARPIAPPAEMVDRRANLASLWLEALRARLASATVRARGLSPLPSGQSANQVRGILAMAAGAPLVALLIVLMLRRLSQFRNVRREAADRADQPLVFGPPGGETGELARLRRMLDDNPWRSDLRYQFVQRLYKTRDATSFAEAALPLKPVASEEIWRRVRAMAEELLPGDARFA